MQIQKQLHQSHELYEPHDDEIVLSFGSKDSYVVADKPVQDFETPWEMNGSNVNCLLSRIKAAVLLEVIFDGEIDKNE